MSLKEKFSTINSNFNVIKACQETQQFIKNFMNFGYSTNEEILKDLSEEIAELNEELILNNKEKIQQEFGDILFVLCNLANQHNLNIEECLDYSTKEFQRRFNYIEGKSSYEDLKSLQMPEIAKLWKEAKQDKK